MKKTFLKTFLADFKFLAVLIIVAFLFSALTEMASARGVSDRPKLDFNIKSVAGTDNDVVLEWKATKANNCVASGGTADWDGEVGTEGEKTITDITKSTNFTMVCAGDDFKVKKTVRKTYKGDSVKRSLSSSDNSLGLYTAYVNGNTYIKVENIERARSIENCELNATNNPAKHVYCVWDGEVIYDNEFGGSSASVSSSTASFGTTTQGQVFQGETNELLIERLMQLLNLYQQMSDLSN